MKYRLQKDGLYILSGDQRQRVGGWIQVMARTRLTDRRHGHGVLLEWQNFDGVKLREVVYARDLNSDNARQVRDMLVDSGYPLTPGQASWSRLQHYLLEQMALAEPATVVDRTGWHGPIFATSGWTAGRADEQHFFVGQLSTSPLLQESGSLQDWQNQVGKLCDGNPLAILSVGVALAAPLLKHAGLENGAFHLGGNSSTGKTTLLQVAASVCGAPTFVRNWVATANGLAAVAAEHNDMALMLDEIGMARPEDVDVAVYHIMNGASKLRANISGGLAAQTHWRTLALSSGEVWLSEVFQEIGKSVKAGQENRLVEIPIFGKFGAFNELHGFSSSQEFVDALKSRTKHYYGTLFRYWIERLAEDVDELPNHIQSEVARLTEQWKTPHMASQVVRVIRRFALITAALCLACRNYLLPWTEAESVRAVHQVVGVWLQSRGHLFNSEEYRLLTRLREAIYKWHYRLADIERGDYGKTAGFRRKVNGERQWLILKDVFLNDLGLPTRYMREVEPLIRKGFFETNELSRGTMKIKVQDRSERFFALWPDRVIAYWDSLPDADELSQFPTNPRFDSGVMENE